uniref:Uncharacterized protein n=1 Tax=mine drainage metagenome TaxID=410659 RepID=E6PQ21_9ZZZZ
MPCWGTGGGGPNAATADGVDRGAGMSGLGDGWPATLEAEAEAETIAFLATTSLPPLSFLVQFMLTPVLDGGNRGTVPTPRQIASNCDIFCRTSPAQCSHTPGERHATQTPRI